MYILKLGVSVSLLIGSSLLALPGRNQLPLNEPVDNLQGKIVQMENARITVRDSQTILRSFRINESTNCIIDFREAPPTHLVVGYHCFSTLRDGRMVASITAFSNATQ